MLLIFKGIHEIGGGRSVYKKPPTTIRRALHALEQPFDFIVLDTPPNLDL